MASLPDEWKTFAGGIVKLLVLGLLIIGSSVLAHEGGETIAQVGPGQAVELFDPNKGLKLSPKAVKMLGLKAIDIPMGPQIRVSRKSAIYIKEDVAVYILREGFFKFVPVKVLTQTSNEVFFDSIAFKSGDQIVIEGVPLLRIAHLNVMSSESEEQSDQETSEEHHEEEGHHD